MRREYLFRSRVGELHRKLPSGLVSSWCDRRKNLHLLPCRTIFSQQRRRSDLRHLPDLCFGRILGRRRERLLEVSGGGTPERDGLSELHRVRLG